MIGGRRKSKMTAGKKSSTSKAARGKSRSLATSLSSLVSAGRGSPRDDFLQRLTRGLMEDGSVDAVTIVDLIEQAIDTRILHPKLNSLAEQLLETAPTGETAKVSTKASKKDHGHDAKHHGKADSKTRLTEAETSKRKLCKCF